MPADIIEDAIIRVAAITAKTRWIFIELKTRSGASGVGEATIQGQEGAVVALFEEMAAVLVKGKTAQELIQALSARTLPTLPASSVASAMDQAAWDLVGKAANIPVSAALDQSHRSLIKVYANINRRTTDRSSQGFAESARLAINSGHQAIKIAPFDEVTARSHELGEIRQAIAPGIARMLAVRDAIGPSLRLMIDCHWRLDKATSEYVIDAAAEAGLYWVECPIQETQENLPAIRALRSYANKRNVLLAGCEEMIRVEGFLPFIQAGAYDVLMPDVKYAGGLAELLRLSRLSVQNGIIISPHNPSGPVCHAASLQVCAAMPQDNFLEMQFDESALFAGLQALSLPTAKEGSIALSSSPGLGISFDDEALSSVTELKRHAMSSSKA